MKYSYEGTKVPFMDGTAEPEDKVQVEIQNEVGKPGKFKLYVHVNGVTVLRFCKIEEIHYDMEG